LIIFIGRKPTKNYQNDVSLQFCENLKLRNDTSSNIKNYQIFYSLFLLIILSDCDYFIFIFSLSFYLHFLFTFIHVCIHCFKEILNSVTHHFFNTMCPFLVSHSKNFGVCILVGTVTCNQNIKPNHNYLPDALIDTVAPLNSWVHFLPHLIAVVLSEL